VCVKDPNLSAALFRESISRVAMRGMRIAIELFNARPGVVGEVNVVS